MYKQAIASGCSLIYCTDLNKYLVGAGVVTTDTDWYGRVWAKVEGTVHLHGTTDEPLPYHIEVAGVFIAGPTENNYPHIKAYRIDLTDAAVLAMSRSEFLARDVIVVKKEAFVHLSKQTRRCNKFRFT